MLVGPTAHAHAKAQHLVRLPEMYHAGKLRIHGAAVRCVSDFMSRVEQVPGVLGRQPMQTCNGSHVCR